MKKQPFIKSIVIFFLSIILLLPLAACEETVLPNGIDIEDPSDALVVYVKSFWDSEIYENAIFDAFYNTKDASDELKSFNRLNALNAKHRILTMSSYTAETVSFEGTKAVVKLNVHGINFGEYAEAFLSAFDQLQGSVMIIEGALFGLTDEQVLNELRYMPISAVTNEKVTFRDESFLFEMEYTEGTGWIIKSPRYRNGKVFIDPFAQHYEAVLSKKYKFRKGFKELEREQHGWAGYSTFWELFKNQWWTILFLLLVAVTLCYGLVKVTLSSIRRKKEEDDALFKKNYERQLQSLSTNAKKIVVSGLTIEVRETQDRAKGKLDPRTLAAAKLTREDFKKNRKTIDSRLLKNEIHLLGPENKEKYSSLEYNRKQFGWKTENLAKEIKSEKLTFTSSHGKIDIYKYGNKSNKLKPAIIYFHGGGFFGGVVSTTANQCKLLAKLINGIVFSVDYPLSPENKYPIGLDCCYESVRWVYENAEKFQIDANRIGVAGDSAGGNLALVSAMRARDEKKNYIRYMALIYPTVTRDYDEDSENYFFNISAYDNPHNDEYLKEQIYAISNDVLELNKLYVTEGTDIMQEYISPITTESFKDLPTALVITAEYDFLRLECEELSRRLKNDGVPSRHIRYGGIVHGTFDRLGYAPQAEDMLLEIAKDLKRLK